MTDEAGAAAHGAMADHLAALPTADSPLLQARVLNERDAQVEKLFIASVQAEAIGALLAEIDRRKAAGR